MPNLRWRCPSPCAGPIVMWLAVAVVLVGPSGTAAPKPDAAAAASGRTTYGRYCTSCHGTTARGDGPLANDLRVPVPDLTTLAARNGGQYPFERVVRIIGSGGELRGHGSRDMPAWGDAFKRTKGIAAPTADAAIRNLAQYIASLQRQPRK